jgi:O-antigen/teichoic acid export membrane protein
MRIFRAPPRLYTRAVSTADDLSPLRLLRRNVLGIYGVYGAAIISGLFVTPIVLASLGTEAYGIWSFIGSAAILLNLLDFGLAPSIIRFGAEYRGRRAREETDALASVGLAVYGAIGLVTAAIGVGLAWLVPVMVSAPTELVWPARFATLLVVAGLAARFPLGLVSNLMLAQQRFDIVNLGNLLSIVLYSALIAAVLSQTGGLVILAVFALIATVVRLAFPLLWLRRELPDLRLSRSFITGERLRRLTSFSIDNFFLHVAGKVVFSMDVIVVGVLLGAGATGLYGIPARLFALAAGISMAGTSLLLPALSELHGADDEARQGRLFLTSLRAATACVLVVGLPFVFIPDLILRAWVGWRFSEPAWVLGLLGTALLLHQPVQVTTQYLIARAQQRTLSRVLLVVVAVNLILSVVLAKLVGLWGVAASTVITEAAAAVIVIPRLVVRASGIRARALATASLLPAVPAMCIAVPVFVGLARVLDFTTLPRLAVLGVSWVVLSCAAVWRFGFAPSERSALRREISPERRRPNAASYGEEQPG